MKVIAEKGGLSGNFTNHSGKRTCATQMYIAGVPVLYSSFFPIVAFPHGKPTI